MSKKAKALWNMYKHGFISLEGVQAALAAGKITQEEYDLITA